MVRHHRSFSRQQHGLYCEDSDDDDKHHYDTVEPVGPDSRYADNYPDSVMNWHQEPTPVQGYTFRQALSRSDSEGKKL